MDIIIDANIVIADLWLQSQRIRFLLDYLQKTQSKIWLLAPVDAEIRAHARRHFREAIVAVAAASEKAARKRVIGVPQIDVDEVLTQTFAAWEQHYTNTILASSVQLPLRDSVLTEAIRRATERVAPCSAEGEQLRDAIIWLNALEYSQDYYPIKTEIAFVSANTRDFAATDKATLHPQLQRDVEERGLHLAYYPSLDDFLQSRAEPLRRITLDWISARVNREELSQYLSRFLADRVELYFRPSRLEDRELYEPVPATDPYIFPFETTIDSFYVWQFDENRTEINFVCSATIEADMGCRRIQPIFTYDPDRDHYYTEIMTCLAEVEADFAAQVVGDTITITDLEDCYPI